MYPGTLALLAADERVRALIRLLLPTFDRPAKATSMQEGSRLLSVASSTSFMEVHLVTSLR